MCSANVLDPRLGSLASPARRLGAYFLDMGIPMVATMVFITSAAVAAEAAEGPTPDAGGGTGAAIAGVALLAYMIVALYLFFRGTTPGKYLLGLRVVRQNGKRAGFITMFVREFFGKMISAMVLSLGFVWILIDKDNQGWHDKLVTTYVVK